MLRCLIGHTFNLVQSYWTNILHIAAQVISCFGVYSLCSLLLLDIYQTDIKTNGCL